MKKFIFKFALIIIFITVIFILGYNMAKNKPIINDTKNITKITITTEPGGDKNIKMTESKSEIAYIVNYINSLDIKKSSDDIGQYSGMGYIITVYYKDMTSEKYIQFYNYFKKSGKKWYKISTKQAKEFDNFYNNLGSN